MKSTITCIALLSCLSCGYAIASSEDVEALRAAYTQWLGNTSFKGHYNVWILRGLDTDNATTQWTLLKQDAPYATGVIAKRSDLVRMSVVYSKALSVSEKSADIYRLTYMPVDYAGNSDVHMQYRPKQAANDGRHFGNEAIFESTKDSMTAKFACRIVQNNVNPLSPRGECTLDPFQEEVTRSENVAYSIDRETDYVIVKSSMRIGDTSTPMKRVEESKWWTIPALPVLSQITQVISDDAGTELVRTNIDLEKMRNCGGLYVPSLIRHSVYFNNKVDLLLWESMDLGESNPSEEDFIVAVPADTIIEGLNKIPPISKNGKRSLDMSTIRGDSLFKPETVILDQAIGAELQRSTITNRSLPRNALIAVNVLAVIVLIALVWRKSRMV